MIPGGACWRRLDMIHPKKTSRRRVAGMHHIMD
jgi:hypothetical protein